MCAFLVVFSMVYVMHTWCFMLHFRYHSWRRESGLSPAPSKVFLLTVPRRYLFCGSFLIFVSCDSHAYASVHCCFVVTCLERNDLLALVCDVYCIFVTFPCGILGLVWYLIVSFPELCLLSYFYYHDRV